MRGGERCCAGRPGADGHRALAHALRAHLQCCTRTHTRASGGAGGGRRCTAKRIEEGHKDARLHLAHGQLTLDGTDLYGVHGFHR